jgi:hypothetical protein
MSDQVWQTVRYILIGGGGFLAGRGKVDPTQVVPMVDQFITIASGAVSLGAAAWGLYVKFRTATVPARVAARPDVPVVSSATGAVT